MFHVGDRWSTHWDAGHNWALVLAAGEGSRLQSLTTTASGIAVPKQFCSFGGGASLLHDALERARVVAPAERTCTVVAEQHERWWRTLPNSIPAQNIVVQPRNRGTANGILLPLLQILHRDADASLIVLPSDHYVRNEDLLAESLQQAMAQGDRRRDRIVLLGLVPEEADPELGYIVPTGKGSSELRDVSEFIEKPNARLARALIEQGALWNSFIFAVHGQTLLRSFEAHCPKVVAEMRRIVAASGDEAARRQELAELYERLPAMDFSRDIVQRSPQGLQVLTVPACGWSDLGTPQRVADAVDRHRPLLKDQITAAHAQGFLDLCARVAPSYAG
jgi:mannose-1-phosphate guanylyltransferase